jgi:uncharacterized membrane protein YphA (DoxX/SURF4 family)
MRYVAIIFPLILGLYFLQVGLTTAFAPSEQLLADFSRWGYPPWFRLVVGLVETVGAVGLLLGSRVKVIAAVAGLWLSATMAGAILTHIVAQDGGWPLPLLLLILNLLVVRLQFSALAAALRAWPARNR